MTKSDFYHELALQIEAIISDETDIIANMANVSALLFEQLAHVNWAGFYRLTGDELVLGPFQGKVACIRIPLGKGVCGTAAATSETQLVGDVHQFDGHIACDPVSNSELVVPIIVEEQVVAVLDIDSPKLSRFDKEDQLGIEQLVDFIQTIWSQQQ